MSAETTTADLTHAVRAAPVVVKAQARYTHRGLHRRRATTDIRAFRVLVLLVLILVAVGVLASFAVGTVAGVWP